MAAAASARQRENRIAAVRQFTRFYTRQIGLLNEHLYDSPFSLTEVRVLYELAHRASTTATELGRGLAIDAGYLSRILRGFERQGLIVKAASPSDARQVLLSISARGRKTFAPLNASSERQVAALLERLPVPEQERLVSSMRAVESILTPRREVQPAIILRDHQPGDMGWVVYRHGVLYSQEYGYDERFEALVAEIVAHFIQKLDRKRERCWIAEREGERIGSVFLVRKSNTVAKLRLLLVEPSARGLGLGKRLVEECIRFARRAGYRKITLWTQSELAAARGIYRATGFTLVRKEPNPMLNSIAETWEMKL
ncbi:MAG TPA: helix-turn-helix domain-containing GNAT family N-acetyltransferase [Terriglobales bacterium]|nr:helix-turn-helix domain-containing GNAT family N-acetyltransferase [Terriglobales bacterium]